MFQGSKHIQFVVSGMLVPPISPRVGVRVRVRINVRVGSLMATGRR